MAVTEINGLKVQYDDTGIGVPVVFIPGVAEPKESFSRQVVGLSQDYRIITYDLRGGKGEFTPQMFAADLLGLLRALRIQTAVICGHSFGGIVAQQFAIGYPQHTAALALISAFPKLPGVSPDRLLSWLTPHGTGPASPIDWLRGLFGKKPDADSAEWLTQQASHIPKVTIDARLRMAQSFDIAARLGEIAAPTLVMVGERDREEMHEAAKTLYEGIGDSALEVIEGGDHFCFFERHDLVNAALDDFITSHMSAIR